jgi:HlyD family secretion protein
MSRTSAERWPVRGPLLGGFIGLGILLGGFGTWAALSEITGAVIAQGRVEVDQNRQIVQHPDGGVVSGILVKEGDVVEAGDLLISLDPNELESELAVVEGQLFEVLARRARLEAERDGAAALRFEPLLAESDNPVVAELMEGQQRLFEARLESAEAEQNQLSKRRDQIRDQIEGIRAQQAATAEQLRLIGLELEDQQSLLDRGLAQATRVLALQREMANLTGQAGELAAAVAQAESRITETEIEILRIETTRREDAITRLRDLQFNEIELSEQRRALIERLDRLDIRAPVSGVVYGMQVFAPRSVIRPADPVLYLIPQDRPLIITTRVEPIHIDQIFAGQAVTVRLPAFDQRRTPELMGRITLVSADAFDDQQAMMSYYRAQVELLPGEIDRLPGGMTLLPGMPVEALIRTQERTPLDYLSKPLADYFARTFRES